MRRFLFAACVALAAIATAPALAEPIGTVGVRQFALSVPDRPQPLSVSLWYPALSDGKTQAIGGSGVFMGIEAVPDAPLSEGSLPLVLIQFGGLRAAPGLGNWLAADLARNGLAVAMIDPPRLTPDQAATAPLEVGHRPRDLSNSLTAIAAMPAIAPHLDMRRIGVIGFFLGGTSALQLAGADIDPDAYARSCDSDAGNPDCRWFKHKGVDLHAIDLQSLAASRRDARFAYAIAVDPELLSSIDSTGKDGTGAPVDIIRLGSPSDNSARNAPDAVLHGNPAARRHTISAKSPFSAFPECTAKGAAILREEEESEAICSDGDGRPRSEVHNDIAGMILRIIAGRQGNGTGIDD
ncbi:putative dienelactone hydrolase [Hartmannibacter diazotrophicus]|uniref:Putative dienelactone hydrolase n=1 Tax=Hartmannibacter diazotrophicus TaxID=1482074 RepID=A0A2C9D8C2_9HYPH|nr:hypothetical protein [Hartmannibacter diazotrophicus]SON56429.1 putative dienelactone hydrolase [Hartmannibacter diazotrophicus]